jgi:hypothetical protein
MSYINMISQKSGVVVFHTKMTCKRGGKVMVPWRKKTRVNIFCYKMGCLNTPLKLIPSLDFKNYNKMWTVSPLFHTFTLLYKATCSFFKNP